MKGGVERALGTRVAYLTTTVLLTAVFAWTFIDHPGRPAPADDPAYGVWRTEMLLVDDPGDLVALEGPARMHAGGYRIATPVLAGLMRRIASVSPITPTVLLAIAGRVLLPLLLAAAACRYRRSPLLWHVVAVGTGSLLLTPVFGGYVDNLLSLCFLTAAFLLVPEARARWSARACLGGLLLATGVTHPTSLAIFLITLGVFFVARAVHRREALRADAPVALVGVASALITIAVWSVGLWGENASFADAALPPPASADFFRTRLMDWLMSLRPIPNVLFLIVGIVGVMRAVSAPREHDLARLAAVWSLPLIGLAGAITSLAYPYYRFLNATPVWLALVGIGLYVVIHRSLEATRDPKRRLAGVAGVSIGIAVIASNFFFGLQRPGWSDPTVAWIEPDERRDLEQLQGLFRPEDDPVLVVDTDASHDPVRIYGFTKRADNVLRYAIPGELQDRTSLYLGSFDELLEESPTEGSSFYEELSEKSLSGIELTSQSAFVIAEPFNELGANAHVSPDSPPQLPDGTGDLLVVADGKAVRTGAGAPEPLDNGTGGPLQLAWSAAALALIFLGPGLLVAPALGDIGPGRIVVSVTLGIATLVLVTAVILALWQSPLRAAQAWVSVAAVLGVSAVARFLASRTSPRGNHDGDGEPANDYK